MFVRIHVESLSEMIDEVGLLLSLGIAPDHVKDRVHDFNVQLLHLKNNDFKLVDLIEIFHLESIILN